MTTINYGNVTIDTAALPPATIDALLRRGISHVLGNEAASRVSAWSEKFAKENGVEPTADEKAQAKAEFQAEFVAAMQEGKLGVRVSTGGTRSVDPVESEMRKLAKAEIVAILKKHGIKVPKGDEAVTFADGSQKTMPDMLATRLDKEGDRLRKAAEHNLKAIAKASGATELEAL